MINYGNISSNPTIVPKKSRPFSVHDNGTENGLTGTELYGDGRTFK